MKIYQIQKTIEEAKRFIDRAEATLKAYDMIPNDFVVGGCKESAACRRASMDLTRSLADLRR